MTMKHRIHQKKSGTSLTFRELTEESNSLNRHFYRYYSLS